jgi:hypothetical protein
VLPHTIVLLALATGGSGLSERAGDLARVLASEATASGPSVDAHGRYRAADRSVTNWRVETVDDLEPRMVSALAALFEADRPVVTRCVRLNNYWCIKSAGWDGEIGRDDDGHVGFSSAEKGADAAATLLRRYYLEFDRKSALDIVRRWAPAECGGAGSSGTMVLAVRGIAGTLRARYLAGRRKVSITASAGKAGTKSAPAPRVSAIIPRAVPTFRVPDIAAGMGERPSAPKAAKPPTLPRQASRPATRTAAAAARAGQPATTGSTSPPAPTFCAPDEQRIQNYAARIGGVLGLKPTDDLELFGEDGVPSANLVPVMLAMSSFELGMLRASVDLVEGAVERAALRARNAAAVGAGSTASPPAGPPDRVAP